MFSRSLLPIIRWHEFSLFSGVSEWPESVYGRDYSDQYQRRITRTPLINNDDISVFNSYKESGPNSYIIRILEDGTLEILTG